MAECNPADFRARSSDQISDVQRLAYLNFITREEFENVTRQGELQGQYDLIGGAASYDEFQQRLSTYTQINQFSSFGRYHRAWATSALDAVGLAGYRACLKGRTGFYLTVATLSDDVSELNFDYFPGTIGNISAPATVAQYYNIENIDEIRNLIGDQQLGSVAREISFFARKSDPTREAYIVIQGGPTSSTTAFLPPPLPVVAPPAVERVFVQMARYNEASENCSEKYGGEFIGSIDPAQRTSVSYNFFTSTVVVGPDQMGNLPLGSYRALIEYASPVPIPGVRILAGGSDFTVDFRATGGRGMGNRRTVPFSVTFTGANPNLVIERQGELPDLRLFIFQAAD